MAEADSRPAGSGRGPAAAWLGGAVLAGLLPQWLFPWGLILLPLVPWLAGRGLKPLLGLRVGRPDPAEAMAFILLAVAGAALFAVLLAWPLARILDAPGTPTVILAGLAGGLGLFMVWRHGLSFVQALRAGGTVPALREAAATEPGRGAGLALALPLSVAWASLALLLLSALLGGAPEGGLRAALLLLHLGGIGVAAVVALRVAALRLPGEAVPAPVAEVAEVAAAPGEADAEDPDQAQPYDPLKAGRRLLEAVRQGRMDEALAALADGADPDTTPEEDDRDQRMPVVLAALHTDLGLLRELIARGADLNRVHAGLTPLLAATRDSWHGRTEAVMMLLTNGADPRQTDADGQTPLHHAARSSDAGVAALLLDAEARLEALDEQGLSPLASACAGGNWRLARFLLERGAAPHPEGGQPALLAAVAGDDDPAGVQLLLRHKARVDATGADGRSALLAACGLGHAAIVQALLEAGADRNLVGGDGDRPLLAAARGGHLEVVRGLVNPRLEADVVDAQARTPLHLACAAPATTPELVRLLLDLGVDPARPDGDGRTALELCVDAGRWPLVAELDPGYPLPASVAEAIEAEAEAELTPAQRLERALRERRFEAAGRALQALALDPPGLAAQLLEYAGESELDVFDWLLAHGADPAQVDANGNGVAFLLLDQGGSCLSSVQRLLDRGEPMAGGGGLARWLAGCLSADTASRACEQMAMGLLERGADAFGAGPDGELPLSLAIRLGWMRLVEELLARGADPNGRDPRGLGALHLACSLGREPAVRVLVAHGGSPLARTPDGQTALGLALAANRRDLAHWLEWNDWPLPARRLVPADLPAAAIPGDLDAVSRLLELGLPVDAVDAQGCTALLRAAGGGHADLVSLLVKAGADPSITARTGATPLSAAVSMRHPEIVKRLLGGGADVDQALPGGVTPLMVAAALGLPDMCSRLLAGGADVHRSDEQGYTAMHCASLFAFGARERQRAVALLDTLLLAGAAADEPSQAGHTPLLLALGARAEPGTACDEEVVLSVLDALSAEDVSLTSQDQRGFGPLHLAALHGLRRVVVRLLRSGADPGARDHLNRTPNDIAILRGFVDVSAEFEPVRSNVSLARFLREPGD